MISPEDSAHLLQGVTVAKEFLEVRQAYSGVGQGSVLLPKDLVPVAQGLEVLVLKSLAVAAPGLYLVGLIRAVFVALDLLWLVVLRVVSVALDLCLVALGVVALGL